MGFSSTVNIYQKVDIYCLSKWFELNIRWIVGILRLSSHAVCVAFRRKVLSAREMLALRLSTN